MTKIYTKNTWQDEILSGAERYDIKENGGTAFKSNMQIVLATSVAQAGTSVDEDKMNNIEDGIDGLDTKVSDMEDDIATIDTALSSGWKAVSQTWTYASADAPVYQVYVSGNVTANADYKLGNKIKCTISSAVKYGFIVKVGSYDSGNNRTPVDIYCGTDYTMSNSAISAVYISKVKSPDGFPMSPDKWTVTLSDTTNRSQASPTNGSYYNPGSLSISCPIGVWNASLSCVFGGRGTNTVYGSVGLSTSTSSITETEASSAFYDYVSTASATVEAMSGVFKTKIITVTSKTTYYVVIKALAAGMASLYLANADAPLTVKLVCAYL